VTGIDGLARIRAVLAEYVDEELIVVTDAQSARQRRSYRAMLEGTYPSGVLLQGRYRTWLTYQDLYTHQVAVSAPLSLALALEALIATLHGEPVRQAM